MSMKATQLLYSIILIFFTQGVYGQVKENKYITVKVVNQNGIPIAGVEVKAYFDSKSGVTNEDGIYSLPILNEKYNYDCCVLKAISPGYKSRTVAFNPDMLSHKIVMQPGEIEKWAPPLCNISVQKVKRYGWDMKVTPPSNAKIENDNGSDYFRTNIRFKSKDGQEWLELGVGSYWTDGVPDKAFLIDENFHEREMTWASGSDYSGTNNNGTKWRFVRYFQQTIVYRYASKAAAEYFDKIIDSMCIDPYEDINGKVMRHTNRLKSELNQENK
jgi:hypothetical protein